MAIAPPSRLATSKTAGSAWRAYLPGAAGVAYVVAWAAGLAVWPVNLALNATAGQVAASYRAHPAEASVQYLLIEGLAGVLLGIVLACELRAARDHAALVHAARDHAALVHAALVHAGRRATGPAVLSAIAVLTSLTQCVIGLFITAAATGGHIASCGTLSDLVNRLDGVKMLALVGATAWIAAMGPALPRWLRGVTVALGLALVASGYAYLALSSALAWTAYVSGPLLLLWVGSAGIALTVTARRRARL